MSSAGEVWMRMIVADVEKTRQEWPRLRYGQAVANTLSEEYPGLFEAVVKADLDPYYFGETDPRLEEVWALVRALVEERVAPFVEEAS